MSWRTLGPLVRYESLHLDLGGRHTPHYCRGVWSTDFDRRFRRRTPHVCFEVHSCYLDCSSRTHCSSNYCCCCDAVMNLDWKSYENSHWSQSDHRDDCSNNPQLLHLHDSCHWSCKCHTNDSHVRSHSHFFFFHRCSHVNCRVVDCSNYYCPRKRWCRRMRCRRCCRICLRYDQLHNCRYSCFYYCCCCSWHCWSSHGNNHRCSERSRVR